MPLTSEAEFANVVEKVLSMIPSGEATYAELIDEIPNRMVLSAEDLAPSLTRRGEPVWHQRVRNITSHKGSIGNAIYEGRFASVRGGLRLVKRAA
jgi:hypothetical protein